MLFSTHVNHVSVSPPNGIGPTQGQGHGVQFPPWSEFFSILVGIVVYGESGRDAIRFYARQRNDRCSVHFEEVTRRRSCICASLTWGRHLTGFQERY